MSGGQTRAAVKEALLSSFNSLPFMGNGNNSDRKQHIHKNFKDLAELSEQERASVCSISIVNVAEAQDRGYVLDASYMDKHVVESQLVPSTINENNSSRSRSIQLIETSEPSSLPKNRFLMRFAGMMACMNFLLPTPALAFTNALPLSSLAGPTRLGVLARYLAGAVAFLFVAAKLRVKKPKKVKYGDWRLDVPK